jgi:TonB family protein
MNVQTFISGLTAYSFQVALLLGVGLALPALLRLPLPRVRLAYWQALLAAILVLPLVQPRPETFAGFAEEIWAGGPWLSRVAAPALAGRSAGMPLSSLFLLVLALGAAARLAWLALGLRTLRAWRRDAVPADLGAEVTAMQAQLGVRARFLISDRVSSPVTFGWRRATVLLPAGFSGLAPAARRSIACHELLHVRRGDWISALFEETVRALLWFHPAVWMLLSRLALSREQVVDAEVVRLTGARRAYLEALRVMALQSGRAAAPGLPFFHRGHLRERVAQLCKEVSMSRSRLIALVTACTAVLAVTAFLGVSSFPMLGSAEAAGKPMKVEGDVQRPQPLSTPAPVYSEAAKASKAEGKAIIECVIDEQGNVTKAELRKSTGSQDLDKAAEETVKTWTFHPATLHGKPVAVSYWLTINFTLDEKDKAKS